MNVAQLKELLSQYDNDMPIFFLRDHRLIVTDKQPFNEENILHTSERYHINSDAPENEWDCEDGKIEKSDQNQYLLINPIIN